jgi:hypothetical protein
MSFYKSPYYILILEYILHLAIWMVLAIIIGIYMYMYVRIICMLHVCYMYVHVC